MKELLNRSVACHRKSLDAGEYSSLELTKAFLEEIEDRDPTLCAYLTVCKDEALLAAEKCDKERRIGDKLPLLHGIPYALKDNICTKGIKTTCASKMLSEYVPPYSAFVYERLQGSGAVLLGKTNMDEFAMGASGENSAFGLIRNPLDTSRVPGGSSGGSAAAVAGGEAVFALGSDTGGSVRQPAALCGVVGMKPTYSSVSRYGLVAFASSLEQIGPITKTVWDNAAVLSAILGRDTRDCTSLERKDGSLLSGIKDGVKGLKIGVAKEFFEEGVSSDVKEAVLSAVLDYKAMGAELTEVSIPSLRYALGAYYVISSAEASSNLARFDGVRYGYRAENYESVDQLYVNSRSCGFGDEVKRRIMLGTFALSQGYYDEYYKKALKIRNLISAEFDAAFEKCHIIVTPTAPTVAGKIGTMADVTEQYGGDICTVPVNLAGLPAISVPCGKGEDGLPVGMQLIGPRFSESALYRAAYAYENKGGEADDK